MKKSISRSESTKRQEKGDESEAKQTSYKAKVFVCVLMYLLASCIIYLSYREYSSIKASLPFSDAKIKKQQNKIELLAQISFTFALIILCHWILKFFITTFSQKKQDALIHTIERSIKNSFEHFIIFIGIYSNSLINQENGYKKKEFVLLANWFILARISSAILSIVDLKTGYSLRQFGSSLGLFTISIILLQIGCGFKLFDHI